jgi:hypothetical protein
MQPGSSRRVNIAAPGRFTRTAATGALVVAALAVQLSTATATERATSSHSMLYLGKTKQCDENDKCGTVAARIHSSHRKISRFRITYTMDCPRRGDVHEKYVLLNKDANVRRIDGKTYISFEHARRSKHTFDSGLVTIFRVHVKGRFRPGRSGSGTFSAKRRIDPGGDGEPETCFPKGPNTIEWYAHFQ